MVQPKNINTAPMVQPKNIDLAPMVQPKKNKEKRDDISIKEEESNQVLMIDGNDKRNT
jgi:hypothetical protein